MGTKVGHLIHTYREAAGIARPDLAAQIGVSDAYLCQIEKNTQRPGRIVVERIIAALALPLDQALMLLSYYAQLPATLVDRIIMEAIDAGDSSYSGIQQRLLSHRIQAAQAGSFRPSNTTERT